jgi:FG-GAP-like repeat
MQAHRVAQGLWAPQTGPIFHCEVKRQLTMPRLLALFVLGLGVVAGGAASAGEWAFSEVVIDQEPLADDRVNDLALGDLNGDGRPDIWLSGRNGEGHQAAWYANRGEREAPWQRFTLLEGSWKYGALGDLDGDDDLDIVAGFDTDEKVYWLKNDGRPEDGGWRRHFLGLTGAPDQVFAQDMDGDGALEVIAAFKDGPVVILRRPADPRQPWRATSVLEDAEGVAGASLGDVDNAGDLDLVFGNGWYENPLPGGDLEGGWTGRPIDEEWPKEARSVVADIDRDGQNDVVLSGEESDAGVAWYRSPEPRSGAWQKTVVTDDYSGVHSLAVADFDDDGRPDILAAEMHTSPSRRVSLFEQGARADQWREHVLATVGAHNARIADLDGDGRLDIAGKNFEEDMRPRVWFNDFDPDQLGLDQWRRTVIETELPHQAT